MKLHTLHITLELDVDEASADALHAGRAAEEWARAAAGAVLAAGVRVTTYGVAVVPVSRAALDEALARVADVARGGS